MLIVFEFLLDKKLIMVENPREIDRNLFTW